MKKNVQFWAGCITGILSVTVLLMLIYSGSRIGALFGVGPVSYKKGLTSEVRTKIDSVYETIDRNYLGYGGESNDAPDEEGLYKGLVESLNDPYSAYMSADEYKKSLESINGSFAGIGAGISANSATGEFVIAYIYDGSPAQESGLMEGDIFATVNGESVKDWNLNELVERVRGEAGTRVNLGLLRGSGKEEINVDVVRGNIDIPSVSGNMLEGETEDVGYIFISNFSTNTAQQFKNMVESLQSEGMRKLIIDIRENPGGEMKSSVNIADYLLGEGTVVYTLDKKGNRQDYTSDKECLGIPLVVLVDENTASAAEILSGALKDHKAATLVGKTTFGKGIVQKFYKLSDGSVIKLTCQKYYTPGGTNIQGVGIEPDVEAELDEERLIEEGYDSQLEAAREIIRNMQ